MEENTKQAKNFRDLGVCEQLVEACEGRGWLVPSKIQAEAIPHALQGRDVIGLAETGSGKTGAFALPIIQALLEKPHPFFACVLSPTRELALQISDEFKALGASIGLKCSVLFGGVDMMEQAKALAKRPHIVVATPGRLLDHLSNTKGFSLKMIKYLVLDEADRLLSMEFEKVIDDILKALSQDRRTYLFSATMTKKKVSDMAFFAEDVHFLARWKGWPRSMKLCSSNPPRKWTWHCRHCPGPAGERRCRERRRD